MTTSSGSEISPAHTLAGAIESIQCSVYDNPTMLMMRWTCLDGKPYSHGYTLREDKSYYNDLVWVRTLTEQDLSVGDHSIEHRHHAQPLVTVYWRFVNDMELKAYMLVHSMLGIDYGLRKGEDDKRSFSQRYWPSSTGLGVFGLPIEYQTKEYFSPSLLPYGAKMVSGWPNGNAH